METILANVKRLCGVTMKAVEINCDVNAYNITIYQHGRIGNSVAHNLSMKKEEIDK
jgi:hypothetical protein